jgi:two-component system, cell cycle response regulator DivK
LAWLEHCRLPMTNVLTQLHAASGVSRTSSVLIADDARGARELYGEYLQFCGFRVVTARDGFEALTLAREDPPDIILMDLSMPRVDGWEAIRELKANPRTAPIPIVAVSGYCEGEAARRARDAGAEVCLAKPCLPSQVARAIHALLHWRAAAEN